MAGLDRLFDQVAILSVIRRRKRWPCLVRSLSAITVRDQPCSCTAIPHYWEPTIRAKLPYLDLIPLDIQPNRDVELLRFKRGELDLINSLNGEYFDKLAATSPQLVHDAARRLIASNSGSTKSQKLRFPGIKKLVQFGKLSTRDFGGGQSRGPGRVVFHGHAQPAAGLFSPANSIPVRHRLKPQAYSPMPRQGLQSDGFRLENGTLKDKMVTQSYFQ